MDKNKVAAILLIFCALFYALLILGIEKISSVALFVGAFLPVLIGALMLFLYMPQLPKQKKIWLLLFFVIPSIVILLMNFKY